jgi:ribosomal protein L7/L12
MSFFNLGGSSADSGSMSYRLGVLERKIDLILDHLGIQHRDETAERIARLMSNGQKIEAIKLYRELTGAGLKEAKDAVEAIGGRS